MVVIALRIQEESGMEWPKIQSCGLDIVNWVGPVLIPMYLLEVLFRNTKKKNPKKKKKTLKRIKHYNKNKKLSFNFV